MRATPSISRWESALSPLQALLAWPAQRPLLMLHSGRVHRRWARWSIMASPAARYRFDGRSHWIGPVSDPLQDVPFSHDPLRDVDRILQATRLSDWKNNAGFFPGAGFPGGWIGYFSYDLGRWIEPSAQIALGAIDDRHWPLIELAWCPAALVYDHINAAWHSVGPDQDLINFTANESSEISTFNLSPFRAYTARGQYLDMVGRTKEYIAAGDIFQANIAQRFTAPFRGSTRALAASAFEQARPWYGAYLELPADQSRAILSLSPELFLHVDPNSRRITTRPIKGTRPASTTTRDLHDSAKDAAELHMIIDLMRNDLGRVCEFASVRVAQSRIIERHPTVQHGVGEVTGIRREDATFGDLLRATFPGGSVTGAPKIRAMQIIDELEPVRRGPYCGAIGFIGDNGATQLNIAIRTLLLDHQRNTIDYFAGAGIVADSDPAAEYAETLAKTAVLDLISSSKRRNVDAHAASASR